MKTWIISISAIVLLTSIFSIIIPESKIGKLVKNIFSVLVIFVIISPLVNIKNQEFSFDYLVDSSEISLDNEYLEFINAKKVEVINNESKNRIEKLGVKNVFVNVCYKYDDYNNFSVESVEINLRNSVIISDKAHIDIKEEIINEISSYLQIDKNLIFIYD